MADKFVSERNLRFLLYEVFDASRITQYPYYAEHSRESFDMALETALKIGKNLLKPKLQEMDKTASEFVGGRVKVHPLLRTFMKECGEGGWIAATFSFDLGGQHLPLILSAACRFIGQRAAPENNRRDADQPVFGIAPDRKVPTLCGQGSLNITAYGKDRRTNPGRKAFHSPGS